MSTKNYDCTLARQNEQELWRKTDQEPVLSELKRRKWNWLRHPLRRSDDIIANQVLHHRVIKEGAPKEYLEERAEKRIVENGPQVHVDGGTWRRQHKTELDGVLFHRERKSISEDKLTPKCVSSCWCK